MKLSDLKKLVEDTIKKYGDISVSCPVYHNLSGTLMQTDPILDIRRFTSKPGLVESVAIIKEKY